MNKSELISSVAEKTQLTKADAKAALEAVLESVVGALESGDKVVLPGFGSFAVVEKGERMGINPKTKEQITIAARKSVKFKAGSEFTGRVK